MEASWIWRYIRKQCIYRDLYFHPEVCLLVCYRYEFVGYLLNVDCLLYPHQTFSWVRSVAFIDSHCESVVSLLSHYRLLFPMWTECSTAGNPLKQNISYRIYDPVIHDRLLSLLTFSWFSNKTCLVILISFKCPLKWYTICDLFVSFFTISL